MRTVFETQSELNEARHQRFIAISKCNVIAAEFHLQTILRLSDELSTMKKPFFKNRILEYIGAGI